MRGMNIRCLTSPSNTVTISSFSGYLILTFMRPPFLHFPARHFFVLLGNFTKINCFNSAWYLSQWTFRLDLRVNFLLHCPHCHVEGFERDAESE